jgi:hypothetical protein
MLNKLSKSASNICALAIIMNDSKDAITQLLMTLHSEDQSELNAFLHFDHSSVKRDQVMQALRSAFRRQKNRMIFSVFLNQLKKELIDREQQGFSANKLERKFLSYLLKDNSQQTAYFSQQISLDHFLVESMIWIASHLGSRGKSESSENLASIFESDLEGYNKFYLYLKLCSMIAYKTIFCSEANSLSVKLFKKLGIYDQELQIDIESTCIHLDSRLIKLLRAEFERCFHSTSEIKQSFLKFGLFILHEEETILHKFAKANFIQGLPHDLQIEIFDLRNRKGSKIFYPELQEILKVAESYLIKQEMRQDKCALK